MSFDQNSTRPGHFTPSWKYVLSKVQEGNYKRFRRKLTIKKVWDAVLEVDQGGEGGDAVVVGSGGVGDLDKVDAFAVAIVVDRLQAFQNLVGLC